MAKTKKQVSRKKKKQKNVRNTKIKQHIIQVFLLSIIIFAIIFLIYQIIRLAVEPTDSFLVEQGKISQSESLIGYVIRDEEVIQTDEEQNKIVQIKNEGERVSIGETVFRYEATNEAELNEDIEELNIKIQEAMEGQKGQEGIFSSDIKALENQIESKLSEVQNKNNIQEIVEYKTDIDGYITKKAKISGELSPAGSYINNLIKQKSDIEAKLKKASKYENAKMGGIVSYRVDGLEETLTPDNFETLSTKTLNDLDLITGQIVTTSSTMGKVINNFECYIAVSTDSEEAKKSEVGDKIEIRLAGNQEIPARIEYIKDEADSKLIVLKITQGVEYLTSYRKISLDVVWWEDDGLRVPNTSIIYENGSSYVIRKKAGILSKILVKVVNENENYSIVTNYKTEELKNMGYTAEEINGMRKISIYDEILANPDIDEIKKELN